MREQRATARRLPFETVAELVAVDRDEAYTMIDAGEVLRTSLARAGFNPR